MRPLGRAAGAADPGSFDSVREALALPRAPRTELWFLRAGRIEIGG